jgi:hypothetical protein
LVRRAVALTVVACGIAALVIWLSRSRQEAGMLGSDPSRPEAETSSFPAPVDSVAGDLSLDDLLRIEPGREKLTPEQQLELERIATLGYVSGSEPVPARTGVLTYERDAAYDGLTLLTYGEGPEARLMDMDGTVVHYWSYPGAKGWPRARALPNGDLLVITAGPPGLLKLNRDSELIWEYKEHAHHDLKVLPDNTICVLVRALTTRPDIQGGASVIDDTVTLLDADGRTIAHISLLQAFERSEFGAQWLVDHPFPDDPDIFHTNSVEPVYRDGRLHLLLSIRSISTVAILDVESGAIVWALAGRWHKQHEAQLVGGNLLLFDNLGPVEEGSATEQSRVLEIDIDTGELVWSYTAPGFFTKRAGAQQRLPNGNTLITESEGARVIEVTRRGEVVWEYVNTRALPGRPDVVLGILRAERLPAGFASGWAG